MQIICTVILATAVVGKGIEGLRSVSFTEKTTTSLLSILLYPFKLFGYAWGGYQALATLFIIFTANVAIIYFLLLWEDKTKDEDRNITLSETGTHGTSGIMTPEEAEKVLYLKTLEETEGSILGVEPESQLLYSVKPEAWLNRNKFVCGASGSQKTTSIVVPDIFQAMRAGESFLVVDPKAEVYSFTAAIAEREGYLIRVLNLVNPRVSNGCHFLGTIDLDNVVLDSQTLANVIMLNTSSEKEAGFWKDVQQGLLTAMIIYVRTDETVPLESRTLAKVYNILLNYSEERLSALFSNLSPRHPSKGPFEIYRKSDPKVRSGALIGLTMRLQVFQDEHIQRIISEDEIDLALPGKQKCAYYIIMSDQENTLDFISAMFFSMFFIKIAKYADSTVCRRCEIPVNCVLDEFANCGVLPSFQRRISTLRSRYVMLTLILQDIGQLMDLYPGNVWATIINNCDINTFLGANEIETTGKFYSNRSGDMTVESTGRRVYHKKVSVMSNHMYDGFTKNESEATRKVFTADEILRLDNKKQIVFLRGQKPLITDKYNYRKHPFYNLIEERHANDYVPAWKNNEVEDFNQISDDEMPDVFQDLEFMDTKTIFQKEAKPIERKVTKERVTDKPVQDESLMDIYLKAIESGTLNQLSDDLLQKIYTTVLDKGSGSTYKATENEPKTEHAQSHISNKEQDSASANEKNYRRLDLNNNKLPKGFDF